MSFICECVFPVSIHKQYSLKTEFKNWVHTKPSIEEERELLLLVVFQKLELNLNCLIFLDRHKYQPLPDEHEWDMRMVPYTPERVDEKEMLSKSEQFYNNMEERRCVRSFGDERIPLSVIRNIIKTASK